MLRPLSWFPTCLRVFAGLASAILAGAAAAQSLPPASAPVGSDYRSGSVPAVGPDVDVSNIGGARSPAPAGASDTPGSDDGTPTPIGRPAPMGGFGPAVAPSEAASAAATPAAAAPRRHGRKEGTGPDGTPNPRGKGVVIISPQ